LHKEGQGSGQDARDGQDINPFAQSMRTIPTKAKEQGRLPNETFAACWCCSMATTPTGLERRSLLFLSGG
jgi:hypothetical protein